MDKKDILKVLAEFNNGSRNFDFINEQELHEIIRSLCLSEYIEGVFYADDIPYHLDGVVVTDLGKAFLEENKLGSKVIKGMKEVIDIIK